jgi:hypothetical protein
MYVPHLRHPNASHSMNNTRGGLCWHQLYSAAPSCSGQGVARSIVLTATASTDVSMCHHCNTSTIPDNSVLTGPTPAVCSTLATRFCVVLSARGPAPQEYVCMKECDMNVGAAGAGTLAPGWVML